ncbi:MAG: hypothetical protein ACI841_002695 [Planctomycetota bacterium]|jgi:hypothetical protein
MPVSGVVVTLARAGHSAELARKWMASDERFVLGEPQGEGGLRLPVTIDTADEQENRDCWEKMQADAGIDFVDVVCVFLS